MENAKYSDVKSKTKIHGKNPWKRSEKGKIDFTKRPIIDYKFPDYLKVEP